MVSFILAKTWERFCVHLGTEANVLNRFFENKIEQLCLQTKGEFLKFKKQDQ